MHRRIVATLVVTLASAAMSVAVAAPASADLTQSLENWRVTGSLTPKKLNEPVTLPQGSTFDGESDIFLFFPIEGALKGTVHVPPFNASLHLLGLVPTTVGVTFTQVGDSTGTLRGAPPSACVGEPSFGCATVDVIAKANLGITMVGTLGASIPTHCETSEPVTFHLKQSLYLFFLFGTGLHFTGTTTLPPMTCQGLEGLVLGPLLTAVMSGPENPFEINIHP